MACRITALGVVGLLANLALSTAACAPAAEAPSEARIAETGAAGGPIAADVSRVLHDIRRADTELLSVSEPDGRFLRTLVAARGARHALEIGGATGYSAIWIGLGLRHTGGRLTTIEYDPERARALAANIARAGLADVVTVVAGDAFSEIPKLTGTFDFVFLDAWKRDYKRFYDMLLPRLEPNGVFVAHNVLNKPEEMGDFLTAIDADPAVVTSIVAPSHEGMSITVKTR